MNHIVHIWLIYQFLQAIIQTNNLEVYWATGSTQERILSLVQYSTPTNYEWREASALIPVTQPTDGKVPPFINNSSINDSLADLYR